MRRGKGRGMKGWEERKKGVQEREKGTEDEGLTMLLRADQQL